MARTRTKEYDRPEDLAPPPVRLDGVIGHERALGVLRSAVDSDRVHHAWIFAGPKGVGKFSTAVAFCAMLLDETTAPDLTGNLAPDPESPTQKLIDHHAHPDLHVINKELSAHSEDAPTRRSKQITIPKKVVDEFLLDPIALAPTRNSKARVTKAFIIDEAELMDRSATNAPVQNSILKTLEEPPPGALIILVTSSEERLLPTIRSRCQRVAFTTLADAEMDEWFKRHASDVDANELAWVKSFADGSPGRAELALNTGLYAWAMELEPLLDELDAGRFEPKLPGVMTGLIKDWADAWVKAHPSASKEAANHAAAGHLFTILSQRSRRALRDLASARGDDPDAFERELGRIETIRAAEGHVRANVNMQIVMEHLAAELA